MRTNSMEKVDCFAAIVKFREVMCLFRPRGGNNFMLMMKLGRDLLET